MPFHDLPDRLREVQGRIESAVQRGGHGQEVAIVAVTKTRSSNAVIAAWDAGIHDVGENRVQEALPKMEQVAVAARWHLIGHLQRNKAKAASRFYLVHSLDSGRLADEIHACGVRQDRAVDTLVQVNIVGEGSKGGYSLAELPAEADRLASMPGLRVRGAMAMAPFGAVEQVLRAVFRGARQARDLLRGAGHPATELSMGMSNDYEVAVEEGATYVRLGTVLFGVRPA